MKNKKNITIAVLTILFVVLTILVTFGYTQTFDSYVYGLISRLISYQNTEIFKLITFFGSTIFIVVFCLFLLIFWRTKRRGLKLGLVVIVSTILNNLIKIIIRRPRPNVTKFVTETTYSFPSGHSMAISTVVLSLIYFIWKSGVVNNKVMQIIYTIVLLIINILVMISRIYLGVHFVTDVIGAFIASSIVVLFLLPILDKKL